MSESRKPTLSKSVRKGVLALKRVVEESNGEVSIKMALDDDIRGRLKPEEVKYVEALIEWESRFFTWIAESADTEE